MRVKYENAICKSNDQFFIISIRLPNKNIEFTKYFAKKFYVYKAE